MRVLLAGSNGQLGRELLANAPAKIAIAAPGRTEMPLTRKSAVDRAVRAARPDLVINAAAYTAVDSAETDPEAAYAVNADGARILAEAAAAAGARMIQISTDFVFDGETSRPYLPGDDPHPLGIYGASKLAGEEAVQAVLPDSSLVIRTSWLYSSHGNNFVNTILKLLVERPRIDVVSDQIGSPTWARNLASAIWRWSGVPNASGLRHFSDAGVASWYDFAVAIRDLASQFGALGPSDARAAVHPIRTANRPTAARRPAVSILDSFASWRELEITPLHWRESLFLMMKESRRPEELPGDSYDG